jgi:hypothetical protein
MAICVAKRNARDKLPGINVRLDRLMPGKRILAIGKKSLFLAAEAFDTEFDDIAGLEKTLRIHSHTDARRRPG